nr:methyltransferase domain-containing protein [uncultured Lichenicoccus sp.]
MDPRREMILSFFDEKAYLAGYPDVPAVIASGGVESGRHHFVTFGFDEPRSPCPSSRRPRLLGSLDPAHLQGVEIGALHYPVVKKAEGSILYVDYADRQTLVDKYKDDPGVNGDEIVEVDAIWGDKSLHECLPAGFKADYVVASHVIEHVPDLIGWLLEIRAILALGGQLRLAVPDRRYTFDYIRHTSQLSDVLDAHVRGARQPLPRMVIDFLLGYRHVSKKDAWLGTVSPEAMRPTCSVEAASGMARNVLKDGRYTDCHCWVFTPQSFAELMEQVVRAGLLNFRCTDFSDTRPFEFEFFVGLSPTDDTEEAAETWQRMARSAFDPDSFLAKHKATAQAATSAGSAAALDVARMQLDEARDQIGILQERVVGLMDAIAIMQREPLDQRNRLNAQIANLEAHIQHDQAASTETQRRLTAIERSTAWRVTAPARAALSRLRQPRRG